MVAIEVTVTATLVMAAVATTSIEDDRSAIMKKFFDIMSRFLCNKTFKLNHH